MNAWLSLEYALSIQDMKRLSWLQSKMAAVVHLADHNEPIDFAYARRLAFTKYLVQSGRLSEGVTR